MTEQVADTNTKQVIKEEPYPSSRYAWGMIVILTIAYISSFIDRYIFGLLAQQIKTDLSLTDTQIGLVGGLAFAIFYATSGVFIGWLADHKRRTYIVGIGIMVWSVATAFSGLAKNYWQLFLCRVGVGAGEAALSPCAMSMIADSFPENKRGKPIAVYTSALVLGAGIANLLSAAIIEWTANTPSLSFPLVGEVAPWQFTFLVVGIPGLLIAIPFFIMREPLRRKEAAAGKEQIGEGHLPDMFKYVGKRRGALIGVTMFGCAMAIIAYAQGTWLPAMFERVWGWEPQRYATVNGIILLVVSPVTIIATGWISDKWREKGRRDAPFILTAIGSVLLVPTAIIAPLMPSGFWAFVLLVPNTIGISIVSCICIVALLQLTPGKVRAQIVALYYMSISLTGAIIGPVGVGLLSEHIFGEDNLHLAMALLPALVGIIPLLLIFRARTSYIQQMDRLEGASE